MDQDKLLRAILMAAAGLIVLLAVISAGYMLFSALLGSSPPIATPTPLPATPVPTTYVVVPSGTFLPTVRPSSGSTAAGPTPAEPQVMGASLAGYGTDQNTYKPGDTASVYITIENTGNVVIENATLNVVVAKYFSFLGYQKIESPTEQMTGLNIQPGATQNATYDITIPSEYEGLSTSGSYQFTVDVIVWGKDIGNFTKTITVS